MVVVTSNPLVVPFDADVAIIGGGPSGSVAALVLASLGLRVIVASHSRVQAFDRTEILAPAASPLLAKLGLEETLLANPTIARACHGIRSYWNSTRLALESFDMHPAGPGWIVSRTAFDRLIVSRAEKTGAIFRHGFRVMDIRRSHGWLISGKYANRDETIHARFLIDASGRMALGARKAGAALTVGPSLVAILDIRDVGFGYHEYGPYLTIEATRHGWWYTIQNPDGSLLLAFVTAGNRADLKSLRLENGFRKSLHETRQIDRIAAAFGPSRISGVKPVLDSRMSRLNRVVGTDWLATGDACTAFDPLSSQGLFNALGTGFFAGHAVASHLDGNKLALSGYSMLVKRTQEKTNTLISQQYLLGYRRYSTPFWKERTSCWVKSL
jgi:flavin-dependent dehydrogenase